MIKAILECLNSKTDTNGNRHWAFIYTDCKTGKRAKGMVCGGESNVASIIGAMGLSYETCYYTRQELPKREFRQFTKDWQYAGCGADELAQFIKGAKV